MLSWYLDNIVCIKKENILLVLSMFSPCGIKPDAAFTTRGFENTGCLRMKAKVLNGNNFNADRDKNLRF